MKTLIVYGTGYDATAGTSEEIGKVLRKEEFDVKVANTKDVKIKAISKYDLATVGSDKQMGRWKGDANPQKSRPPSLVLL